MQDEKAGGTGGKNWGVLRLRQHGGGRHVEHVVVMVRGPDDDAGGLDRVRCKAVSWWRRQNVRMWGRFAIICLRRMCRLALLGGRVFSKEVFLRLKKQ